MKRLLFLILFISCSSYAAGIKKWTDENGQVHYGDSPPLKSQSESIRVSRPPSDPGKPLPRFSGSKEEDNQADTETTTAAPQQKERPETTAEDAAKLCASAKKDLATLRRSNRIRMKSDDGTVHYMTSEEIAERKKQSQEDIDQFCKDQ